MEHLKYDNLKQLLSQNKNWPMLYMFKFIVPNANNKVKLVTSMMPIEGIISYRHTENFKFVSITCKVMMPSAESIIDLSAKVCAIEGVVGL